MPRRLQGHACSAVLALHCSALDGGGQIGPERVVIHHGGERVRTRERLSTDLLGDDLTLTPTDIVVTTYGLLARDVDLLSEVAWDTLVLDEAQAVKNPETRLRQAVATLRAESRFCITGTPR